MKKNTIVVAFFGLPGSGKGVQADRVVQEFGLYNFDTGRILEAIWGDPARQDDPLVIREKKNFEDGILVDPDFVFTEVVRSVRLLAQDGTGIVFSGSPRTMFEAEGLIPVLDELYGKDNLHFFFLDIDPLIAAARNARRMTCRDCLPPVPPEAYDDGPPHVCPRCGGPLYRRKLDVPTAIPVRHREFRERTLPIVAWLREKGYAIENLSGELPAPEIFSKVKDIIQSRQNKS